jgi:hypothetical protein
MVLVYNKNTYENIAGQLLLFTSVACVILSATMYYKNFEDTFLLTTTTPFVNFQYLRDIYLRTTTIGQGVNMSYTLLDTAWCFEKSGNFNLNPETRSAACTCINTEYAKFMQEILTPLVNNTNITNNLFNYLTTPWINDPTSKNLYISYKYNTSKIQPSIITKYSQTTLLCYKQRSVWRISEYPLKLHPICMAFFSSYCMFIFAFSYMAQVASSPETGKWARYLLLLFSVAAGTFLLAMDWAGNWMYAIAIIVINLNFGVALADEFMSLDDKRVIPEEPGVLFCAPHPMMVGLWNYVIVSFPTLLIYLGLTNYIRDVVALLGLYVLGYTVSVAMERGFWSKYYLQFGAKLKMNQFGAVNGIHTINRMQAKPYTELMVVTCYIIFFVLATMTGVTIFMNWYEQNFSLGNWVAMILGLTYVAMFVLDMSDMNPPHNIEKMSFGWRQTLQIMMIVFINTTFVIVTIIDSSL